VIRDTLFQERLYQETMYRSGKLSIKQRAQLASVWEDWSRRREGLAERMNAADRVLDDLPTLCDLPAEVLTHLCQVADGLSCRAGSPVHSSGCYVDPGEAFSRWNGARARFVGEGAAQVNVATRALCMLEEAQELDSQLVTDCSTCLSLPSSTLPSLFHVLVYDAHVDFRVVHFDHLAMCRLAAEDVKRGVLFTKLPLAKMSELMPWMIESCG
jgi:hypothetical protein